MAKFLFLIPDRTHVTDNAPICNKMKQIFFKYICEAIYGTVCSKDVQITQKLIFCKKECPKTFNSFDT